MSSALPATSHLPARADWLPAAAGWRLQLAGDWAAGAGSWPEPPAGLGPQTPVAFDTAALQAWDSGLPARLWALCAVLRQQAVPVDLDGLPPGLRGALQLAQADPAPPQRPATGPRPPSEAAITVAFFGDVLLALGRWLRGQGRVRGADVLQQLDETGPRSLPVVLLTCGLVGLMLAYMGGAQLGRIGAQGYLADVVAVGMVRELAGLMTAVILAGRVGAAFAAELGSMQAGEEIDALRVLGVDPVTHLVLPRLLALLLMAPALMACGALAGVAAGWPPAVLAYGVTSAEYWHQALRALNFTHLWIGLFKGMLYVALVAVAGCRCGLHAGRSAQAVGQATTAAVVKALVWVVAAATGTTMVFTNLGF
ncbi:MlaE family ABC transporter permease [Pseudaquabacterium pictum]|uniref:ABC transporter permease n=1 Tax=Pseudaquabacterium pictum TaxID=2315236 RepID=A0A480AR36_9BURK|nr:ABC transporter permease [Rubrivivax pictus]GCL63300.1 ABC transporter permease [Rubrivivax pictus]